jgi:hypothetical protein
MSPALSTRAHQRTRGGFTYFGPDYTEAAIGVRGTNTRASVYCGERGRGTLCASFYSSGQSAEFRFDFDPAQLRDLAQRLTDAADFLEGME